MDHDCLVCIRYWQTHKGLVAKEIFKDVCTLLENKALNNFIRRNTKHRVDNPFLVGSIQKNHGIWSVTYANITDAQYNKKGKITGYSSNSQTLEIEGARGILLISRLYLEALITKPGFTSFATPYFLFYIAIYLGISHSL